MIEIDDTLVEQIRNHAQASYPRECCGALIGATTGGNAGGNVHHVTDVIELDNRRAGDSATRRFLVTADDFRDIEKTAAERGLDVVGFYHSHPGHEATPSEYDRDHAMPWYAYVIVSVAKGTAGDVKCWTLKDDRSDFFERPLEKRPFGDSNGMPEAR